MFGQALHLIGVLLIAVLILIAAWLVLWLLVGLVWGLPLVIREEWRNSSDRGRIGLLVFLGFLVICAILAAADWISSHHWS